MSDISQDFRRELIKLGIISHREHESLWSIAKRCAVTTGVPMGGGGAAMMASAGTVMVPGVGAVPGAVAGFLAGLAAGTAMCTAANVAYRNELRKLAGN
ncbi:hypothetical protein [Ramlibacter sp.]|uniref:hypothetical protein n=1 Tax=Ramlibacter sp. TaxID=1917967 RepID=UPI002D4B87A6|nr:hypothetical protein [Ramlibacter sp.]HYD77452.1 hypothetical protein [Ramlibacter sp.]